MASKIYRFTLSWTCSSIKAGLGELKKIFMNEWWWVSTAGTVAFCTCVQVCRRWWLLSGIGSVLHTRYQLRWKVDWWTQEHNTCWPERLLLIECLSSLSPWAEVYQDMRGRRSLTTSSFVVRKAIISIVSGEVEGKETFLAYNFAAAEELYTDECHLTFKRVCCKKCKSKLKFKIKIKI